MLHAIITYQEKLGNYNIKSLRYLIKAIITYQEKLGNYNSAMTGFCVAVL